MTIICEKCKEKADVFIRYEDNNNWVAYQLCKCFNYKACFESRIDDQVIVRLMEFSIKR